MPNSKTVSFTAPQDYATQLADIERRRKMADLLQAQSLQPIEQPSSVGGMVPRTSWTQGLAKMAQAYSGGKMREEANAKERDIGERYKNDLGVTLSRALQAGSGTPAKDAITLPDDVAGPVQGAQAAVAPNPQQMASILMEHPATQQMGQQQLMQDMQRKALLAAFSGQGQGQPAGQPAQPGAPTQAAGPQMGGPAGGVPMSVWLQTDPAGNSYAKQLAKDYAEVRKPVVNRGFGIGTMGGPGGAYVPDPASTTQAASTAGAVEEAKAAAAAPYSMQQMDVPVYLPGGDQINVKMNATQAHQYQTTGQLPPEIAASIPGYRQATPAGAQPGQAGPALAPTMSPQEQAAARNDYAAHGSALPPYGRPVVGRTQSQGEQVVQAGQTAEAQAKGKGIGGLSFEAPEARKAVADATTNLSRMESEASAIMNDTALRRTTGIMGALPNMPGSAASDVQARIGALKSQVGFAVLQAMRDASKTGGALGQISDKENELLQRNLAALDQSQSPEAFRRNLQQVITYAKGARERISNAYRDQYERVVGTQGMQPSPLGATSAGAAQPSQSSRKVVKFGDL